MLEVKGFRGFRFDVERVGSLDRVVTPPYDVISPEERRDFARLSPHNMVHVVLPEALDELTPHQVAARNLEEWIAQGALRQDPEECLYIIEQAFLDSAGVGRFRRGFLGAVKLPEPGEDPILGHEGTFKHVLDDRRRLIEATRANLSPVFALYSDEKNALDGFLNQLAKRPPDALAHTADGVAQRLWLAANDKAITEFFRDKRLYIADGHHRFHTACAYRDAMRDIEKPDGPRAYDYILMALVSLADPGLDINPTHRLMPTPEDFQPAAFLTALDQWFEVTPVNDELAAKVQGEPGCVFGVAIHGVGRYLVRLRDVDRAEMLGAAHGPAWRDLDVAVLHRGVLEKVLGIEEGTQLTYERDARAALAAVESGRYGLAFLLKAVHAGQIRACAEAGEPMPHKSTYFFPKMPSGLVIHRLV